jgi:hypothetical protein
MLWLVESRRYPNNGILGSGKVEQCTYLVFFLKKKLRNEIIISKNQHSNIPPFHHPIRFTRNMFHIKILLFQQIVEISRRLLTEPTKLDPTDWGRIGGVACSVGYRL